MLFQLFGVDVLWWQTFWTVSVSFLVMAVIPTIAIAELAQRGKILIAIVSLYTANELGITLATAGIWFINLIIPAVVGSLLILRIKKIMKEVYYPIAIQEISIGEFMGKPATCIVCLTGKGSPLNRFA